MKKIVIIGGGIAGLSAGCYGKMNGYDVHIYEMSHTPGGLCTSWNRKGFTFDGCIQWLLGSVSESPYYKIWEELGAIQDTKCYYKKMPLKMKIKDQNIYFYNDPNKLEKYLKEIAPEDSDLIDELITVVKQFDSLNNFPLMKPQELFNFIDTLKMMVDFLPFLSFFKYKNTTIHDFAHRFKNPILKEAICLLEHSTSSQDFLSIPCVLATKDLGFPEGGSLKFAKKIEQRFINLGGKINYNAKVQNISVEEDKVEGIELEDGITVNADLVISAADGYTTIFKMIDQKYINKKIRNLYRNESVFPSNLQISLGVDMDLSKETQAFEHFYKLDKSIKIGDEEKDHFLVRNYAFDPTLAPKGKTVLTISFPCKSEYWEKLYLNREKYIEEKKRIENDVISNLDKIYPGIRNKIIVTDVATPMTLIRYTNNWKGSIMGFEKSVFLNIPRTLPKLKNFYMVGHWVGGTGVTGAAKSGRDCIEYICKKDKKGFVTI
jgi:phytoene dehydrogenase-like protein